ncbi:MAG: superinfection immunity protein [Chloroflexi bacterium]|nr:superinfection immunity protein [Chloroflexota bacterium]
MDPAVVLSSPHPPAGLILAFGVIALLLVLAAAAVYYIPTYVAADRDHRSLVGILLLNLLLGWTVVGWFGALAWAMSTRRGLPAPAASGELAPEI